MANDDKAHDARNALAAGEEALQTLRSLRAALPPGDKRIRRSTSKSPGR